MNLPSTGSFHKWPQREVEQVKAKNLKLDLGLLPKWQGPATWAIFHCFPSMLAGNWSRNEAART